MARQIVVEVVGNAGKFSAATDQAVTKAEGLTGKLQGIGKGMVIGAGIAAFNLLGDAIQFGISKIGAAEDAFKDAQASQVLLANSLKNNVAEWNGNTNAVDAYTKKQLDLGFSADDVRASIAKLVGVTHDVAAAQDLASEAEDLARSKNIDLATATSILVKAHEGNFKALKSLGIQIPKNATASQALAIIQKNVNGASLAYANTAAGQQLAAQQKVQESMVKIGSVINQVASVVIPALAGAFSTLVDWFQGVWPTVEPVIMQVVNVVGAAFQWWIDNVLPELTAAFNWISSNVVPALGTAFDWIVKNVLPVVVSAITFFYKTVLPAVANAIDWITKNVIPPLGAAIGWIVKNVLPPLETAFGFVTKTVLPAIGAAIGILTNTVIPALGNAFNAVATVVSRVWSGITSAIKGAINVVIGAIDAIIGGINGIQLHIDLKPPIGPELKFDWDGMRLGKIPYLHAGGIVPGQPGADVPAILQAGERVIPRGGDSGRAIHIHIDQGAYIDGPGIDRLARQLAQRLRYSNA